MKSIDPNPWIFAIPEYVPGRSKEEIARKYGVDNPIKLASNENPLGPSPNAIQALQSALASSHLYPDPDSRDLLAAASGFFGCSPDSILAGNGSDEIIDLVCRAYLKPGDEVVVPECTFSYYRIAALACGATVAFSPMKDHRIDASGILATLSPATKIVFVANPNNPTGTYLEREEIMHLLDSVPEDVLVVIDEAYGAFARASDFMSAVPLVPERMNLLTVHTMSKSHGLAGLRVGFAIARSDILGTLLRIKPPFNMNILAQKAGQAALNDRDFFIKTLNNTWEGLDFLYNELLSMGLGYITSQTNFVLVRIGSSAYRVYEDLLKKGIITRYMAGIGLDEYIRVSIGLPAENRAFIAALKEVL